MSNDNDWMVFKVNYMIYGSEPVKVEVIVFFFLNIRVLYGYIWYFLMRYSNETKNVFNQHYT